MARYKRKIRNLIIDTRFQAKYTLLVLLVSVLIFLVLGWLYIEEWEAGNEILDEINPIVKKAAPVPASASSELDEINAITGGAGLDQQQAADLKALEHDTDQVLAKRSKQRLAIMVGSVGLLVVLLAGLSIWLSHKAAGPVYAVSLFIKAARRGEWGRIRPLRKGDEFAYLATEFLGLVADIKKKEAQELQSLDVCAEALAAGQLDEVASLLDALRQSKAAYLKDSSVEAEKAVAKELADNDASKDKDTNQA